MEDIVKLIQSIIDQGSIGTILLLVAVLLIGAATAIWTQRQSISRYETQNKLIELNMTSADRAYQANKESQAQIVVGLREQNEAIHRLNQSLQIEIERIKTDQKRFEDDVKQAMRIGVDEVKATLQNFTVREIVEQIPESFRQDLEDEMKLAIQSAILNVNSQLANIKTEIASPDFARAIATTVGESLAGQVMRRLSPFERTSSVPSADSDS